MEKKFESLNKYNNRNYKLYSTDVNEESYELLIFDHQKGVTNTHYLRYPQTEYFIELFGGIKSSCGTKNQFSGSNIWKNTKYEDKIIIYCDNDKICLIDNGIDFHFMKLIGDSNSTDRMNRAYLGAKIANVEYLKLPEDVYLIDEILKSDEIIPLYVVLYYPKYKCGYDQYKFKIIINSSDVIEHKITDHQVYRDGGTTYITTTDVNGIKHKFYSPTPFNYDELVKPPTYDEVKLTKYITDQEREMVIRLLGIELAQKFDK